MVKQSQSAEIVALVEAVLEEIVVYLEIIVIVIEVQGIKYAGCPWKRYLVALKKKIQSVVAATNLIRDLQKHFQKKFQQQ